MTPTQCRAARGLIGMSQAGLAAAAALPLTTIVDYETSLSFAGEEADLDAIRDALEKAGIEFTVGERPWVRLRKG
jgi:hypothetical protein